MDRAECEDLVSRPGRFQGEAAYVPYYWDAFLDGMADEDDNGILSFRVSSTDRSLFPELGDRETVYLYQRDEGFVCECEDPWPTVLEHEGWTFATEYHGERGDGRSMYRWTVIAPDGRTWTDTDLGAPMMRIAGTSEREADARMTASLLSFLGACLESIAYGERSPYGPGENAELFPRDLVDALRAAGIDADTLSILSLDTYGEE